MDDNTTLSFTVTDQDGNTVTTDATITGSITALPGTISGWKLSDASQKEIDHLNKRDEAFIVFGDDVKVLSEDENGVKVGGHLVRFGDPEHPDLSKARDFFTKETNFGLKPGERKHVPVYFNHAMPLKTADNKYLLIDEEVGEGEIWTEDSGILIEAILYNRKEYEKAIAGQYKSLGWSSGTMGHVMKREPQPNGSNWVKRWIIGEGSVTPMPAEPRKENNVIPLKSLKTPEAAIADKGETNNAAQTAKENIKMNEELKTLFGEFKTELLNEVKTVAKEAAEPAAEQALEKVLDKLPEVKAKMNGTVEVTVAAEDREFRNIGENAIAVSKHVKGLATHPRIRGLQAKAIAAAKAVGDEAAVEAAYKAALGSNEAVPSQGEFLLEPTITRELIKPIHEQGVFSTKVRKLPVGPNSNSGWIPGVDETSRATGSRWGGVRGYHSAEAGTMTASQPKFRKINWELHKTYVLQYATDELLADANMLTAIINQSSAEELNFMVNDDLLNGVGGDRPVGVLNSGALVSIARVATSAISHADILNMWQRLHPRFRAGAEWYINSDVEPQLDALTFTSGSTGILSPYVTYAQDGVMRIKGRPVNVTEFNPSLGTAGDLLLANFDDYLMWEKGAIEAAMSIHVQFLTDQTAFRFIARYDGQTALASAITPYKGSNTQSPFVALLATT